MLPQYEKNLTSASAVGLVFAARLPQELMKEAAFYTELYQEAAEEIIMLNKEAFDLLNVKDDHVYKVVKNSRVKSF